VSAGVATLGCVDDEWWPEDEEDGAPVRPSASPGRATARPDYRPLPGLLADGPDDVPDEEPVQQIYAPTPIEGKTALAGVPVPLPPRQALPPQPPSAVPPAIPRQGEAPQYEQVQPGQQVSPEWRGERELPHDLPQAPESAWAQPPTAPLPVVGPRPAPANVSAPAKQAGPRAPVGVPHQVPPAPMPRPADDLARGRAERRPGPSAEMDLQGAVRRSTFGPISAAPGRREQEPQTDLELIGRRFGGLRQITVVNPAARAGKSVAAQLLAMTFGQHRDEPVLAWDTGETAGTLGLLAQPVARGFAEVHPQAGFDVLATNESTVDFASIHDALGASYKILVVATGDDPGAPDWRAAIDATDQLALTIVGRNESAEAAARVLDHLERLGRVRTARQAVTLLALPENQSEVDAPGIERHFAARTRAVVRIPYDHAVQARPIDYRQLSDATRTAWVRAAAAIAEGL
jgi:hypothetical protein